MNSNVTRGFAPRREGFTLIELMLVVVIIGILVSMVMPRIANRSEEAKISAAKADIQANLTLALDLFRLDNGRYPMTEEGLEALLRSPSGVETWKGPYLRNGKIADPWSRRYVYRSPGNHHPDEFDLASLGPNGAEGDVDDITNWE